ncbi:MAG: beta-galactosidase [Planctomycetota bacterium]
MSRIPTAVLVVCILIPAASGGELLLFDFERGFDPTKVARRDLTLSTVAEGGDAKLRLTTGHKEPWPGIDLPAPEGKWDLSSFDFVAMDVQNVGKSQATLCLRVDNPGADGRKNCNTDSISLKPGESGILKVQFRRKPQMAADIKLFGMRGYPKPFGHDEPAIDPSRVVNLVVFVPRPKADHAFAIDNIRAGGSYAPPKEQMTAESFFPFIDTFGQYIHKDWPGKTRSIEDLHRRREEEAKELAAKPGPEDWNRYGGWADGPTLDATGFFRVAKHQGKWWLVDPLGKLFWSHGIDCVHPWSGTPIDERAYWFRDFPGDRPEFKDLFGVQKRVVRGYYKGKEPRWFDFAGANIRRKYGDEWKAEFANVTHRRLRSWGLNTIANWSSADIYLLQKTPYVGTIHFWSKELAGSRGYWSKFRDVFDPAFAQAIRDRMAKEKDRSAGDSWCIGYFVDNEISWGNDTSLAVATLVSPPEQKAKQVFVADLKAKYGAIAKLNAAWGTSHASWEALLNSRKAPKAKKARADLRAFYSKTCETYFRTIRDAVKAVAPHQLYLGCRFAWANRRVVAAAVKYCDVVSYNLYRYPDRIARFKMPVDADVPLIIGEFHFGALDRGMFHTGLRPVEDQAARAEAYRTYVLNALRHPQFVGTGWFQYKDQCPTGRPLDGENYQIGFVDLCDTPYPETIAACRQVGYRLYQTRLGDE